MVSYESIRKWCNKFGSFYARRLKRRLQGFGDIFYLDEVFVNIQGVKQYLCRAVDQDGDVIDVFLQKRRNTAAAKRFFKLLLKVFPDGPRRIITDKLRSYRIAYRELLPEVIHDTSRYANNRAEPLYQPTRVRERGMRGLKISQTGATFLRCARGHLQLFQSGSSSNFYKH